MKIREDLKNYMNDFLEKINLKENDIFVLGCSTSEVNGERIGSRTNIEVGTDIVSTLKEILDERRIFMAVQCCEHLNRAIVVEDEILDYYDLEEVSVIPVETAGGGIATSAMNIFKKPIVVEFISANAGIDIGDTEIGMHVRYVQVPYRSNIKYIGNARITGLYSRKKLIGGKRAVYDK